MGSRHEVLRDALPIELWPGAVSAGCEGKALAQFQANVEAMRLYFTSVPVKEIEKRTGIARNSLSRLARRCLSMADDGRIHGFRACIPFLRVAPYERRRALTAHIPGERSGMVGALGMTLAHFPDVEKQLVQYIVNEAKHLAVPEHKLRPCDLHRIFLRCLKACGVQDQEWPFNTQYRGLRTITRFMRAVLDENFSKGVARRGESAARAHLAVGSSVPTILNFDEPFDAVEIDAHKIEAHMTVAFLTPEGIETDVRLDRVNLLAVVDRFSSAVLAYTIVYRPEVSADDILKVIRQAATGMWKPMELTIPNLSYPNGAGLPSGVIPEAQGALWSVTLFDGALAHLASAVHARARGALGFAINWGPVAHFERRPNVERTFNQISKTLFKRLPSTTGSHPKSGRADEAEQKAIKHHIRAADVEQLLDVTFAQHNATPTEGVSFLSPLDAIRYFIDRPERFESRKRPKHLAAQAGFHNYEKAVVRGNRETGRRPYVQVDRVHYSNPILADSGHLIGADVLLEIDEEDMRQLKAYLGNGAELGILKAHGKWGQTKHSRRTRKAINGLLSKRVIVVSTFDDPMQVYLQYLVSLGKKGSVQRPNPKQATEIVRVKKEAGLPTTVIAPPIVKHTPDPSVSRVLDAIPSNLMSDIAPDFFTKVRNRR